jgi:type I restriction enzyme S subunit
MTPWPIVPLSEVFEISRGGSPRPIDDYITDDLNGVNWIMIGDASEGGKYIDRTRKRIRLEGARRSRWVKPGDFLLTNSMSFGRPYIARTSGCIHDGWLVLSPRRADVHPDFFYHLLGSKAIYAEFERRAAGATVKNLNIDLVRSVSIPLPPLGQQRRIADILDKANALRAKRRCARAQLNALTQSIFLEMFGDPLANPKNWPLVLVGDHAVKIGSGATPTGGEVAYKASGIALIRSMNVRDGYFERRGLAFIDEQQARRLDNVIVEKDDVLLNITGASVARVCRVPASVLPARVNQHVAILRLSSELNPVFVESCLLSESFKRRLLGIAGAGATRQAITKAQIEKLSIVLPPRALQNRFAAAVAGAARVREAQDNSMQALDTLFASLQHRAFRGEL